MNSIDLITNRHKIGRSVIGVEALFRAQEAFGGLAPFLSPLLGIIRRIKAAKGVTLEICLLKDVAGYDCGIKRIRLH